MTDTPTESFESERYVRHVELVATTIAWELHAKSLDELEVSVSRIFRSLARNVVSQYVGHFDEHEPATAKLLREGPASQEVADAVMHHESTTDGFVCSADGKFYTNITLESHKFAYGYPIHPCTKPDEPHPTATLRSTVTVDPQSTEGGGQ